ncbi:hypothetical protein WICPIJ_002623 [Wickerhamomyces pijperi]|uniref:RNA helicase n=1 Tax=Wickerhamomyces pijperi TaxID=599730 RepID=A0A9P8Q9B9_WICPI|nr:hypothetical protein WICPIJ_002623 [Wickerhamomyces pijperi]
MDIFRVLTRGASLKKTKEITTDYSLPGASKQGKKDKLKAKNLEKQVSKEIDFFKTNKFQDKAEASEDEEEEEEEVAFYEKKAPNKVTTEEEARQLRKVNKAKITGDDIPLPIASFNDIKSRFTISPELLANLDVLGFDKPTAIQSETIPISLFHRDLIACAPTGSGKTLAFLVPLIQQIQDLKNKNEDDVLKGVILSPTKELAKQIYEVALKLSKGMGLNITLLSKSLNAKFKNGVIKKNKYELIITTPLRLIDLMTNLDPSSKVLDFQKLKFLIMDEADKLFDKTFIAQTDEIVSKITTNNAKLQKLMFSATIPSKIEQIASSVLIDPIRVIIGHKEAANDSIEQKLVYTGNEEGKLLAIRQLIQESEFRPPIIIFLQSIARAKALYHELLYDNLKIEVLHSEKTQTQRDDIIARFKKGDVWCLICTDVLSRGLDFKKINLVLNYDVPLTAQDYVHRIGRTGRGGKIGKAITLYTNQDTQLIKPILNVMKQNGVEMEGWLQNLAADKKGYREAKGKRVERKQISTVPRVVKMKRKHKNQMIEDSKKRKLQQSPNKL